MAKDSWKEHMLGSIFGLMLLILAQGLYRRLEGAYWVALIVLLLGIVVSLVKGFDYEEAALLLLAAVVIWSGRHEFNRRASLYHPEWHPKYLAAPGGIALPRVLIDATTLISGGVKGVFAR